MRCGGFVHDPACVEIGEACDVVACVGCAGAKGFEQLLHGEFAFAEDDEVRASLQIFERVGAGLGAADDGLPSCFACDFENFDDVAARHQIGVDAEDRRGFGAQMLEESFAAGEGGVEDVDVEALLAKMRAEIQDAKRSVRLHDLKLFGIFVEKIAVREQELRHLGLPRCSG